MKEATILLPWWAKDLFNTEYLPHMPAKDIFNPLYRYHIWYGGRAGGKSETMARLYILLSSTDTHRLICARQTTASLEESSYALIKRLIYDYELEDNYIFTKHKIRHKLTQSEIMFFGLDIGVDKILSIDHVSCLWLEEAHFLKHYAWERIKPSIRRSGSKIFATFNPRYSHDCLHKDYIANHETRPAGASVVKVNYTDNPYFHLSDVLEQERQDSLLKNKDNIGMYMHIWEGELLHHSDSQIFNGKWTVESFEEPPAYKTHFYYGLDFGYSVDPTAAVRCFIEDDNLYITHEFYSTKIELNDIGAKCSAVIPGFKQSMVTADCAMPSAISLMNNQGYNVRSCEKGANSIVEGITYLRTFKQIIIHERCKNTIDEFKDYSYKLDNAGDVTTVIDSKAGNDHIIDALRYALEKLMKHSQANYKAFKNSGYKTNIPLVNRTWPI